VRLQHSTSTLFPYTTLFRSVRGIVEENVEAGFVLHQRHCEITRREAQRGLTGAELQRRREYWIVIPTVRERRIAEAHLGKGNVLDRKSTRLNSSHVSISYAV